MCKCWHSWQQSMEVYTYVNNPLSGSSESDHMVHEVEMSVHAPRQQEQQRHRKFLQYSYETCDLQ